MTCIVAVWSEKDQCTWLAGDSALIGDDFTLYPLAEPKVSVRGRVGVGYAGNLRFGQVVTWGFNPPSLDHGDDVSAWMHTQWLPAYRHALHDAGQIREPTDPADGTEQTFGELVVVVGERIFTVGDDLSIGEWELYGAIGAGAAYAMGALHTLAPRGLRRPAAEKALEAAAAHNAGVLPPWTVLRVPAG